MNSNKSGEIYIAISLLLLGIIFCLNYFEYSNILDLLYGGLLVVYSFKLYYLKIIKM